MTTLRAGLIFGLLTALAGCTNDPGEPATTESSVGELRGAELVELSCDGRSSVDTSKAKVRYDGGDTVDVTVDRSVCSFMFGVPVGCVPQHNRVTLDILEKTVTASKVKLVLDNDGTDLDLSISTGDKTGTWFAHENHYTYDLTCDTVEIAAK